MKFPGAFPVFRFNESELADGYMVAATSFCKERIARGEMKCRQHYAALERSPHSGFTLCPFGFTSYRVGLRNDVFVITGVVAAPRFGDAKERERAKAFPDIRVSRESVVENAEALKATDIEVERLEQEAKRRLPQALHELRKLNAIVKQGAESLGPEAENVVSAAQLMSNIFEIVEVLANIEEISLASEKEYIALFDLAFKAKKVYQVRAKLRSMPISVHGDDSFGVRGDKKYFPIVLQVLLDNAIKYGRRSTTIDVSVSLDGESGVLIVSNKSDHTIDPVACFRKGFRSNIEGTDGDGLGLYLAERIVRAHGGSIECQVKGDVVSFTVKMPVFPVKRKKY